MKKISSLVKHQVPSFANEEYPLFVAFMEAYYEWLEEDGNTLDFLENYQTNLDVDLANDEFIAEYLEEFVEYLPKEKKIDDPTLIKYIKEFYLSKGSEQSFRFLFTILFNEAVKIIYPREVMFRASDGTWDGDIYLKLTNVNYDKLDLSDPDANIKVVGRKSGAIAIVDSMEKFINSDTSYTLLELSSFTKDFIVGERVNLHVNNAVVIETTIGAIVDMKINDGGSGNSVGDLVHINTNNIGMDFAGKVSSVSDGELNRYSIEIAGEGYEVGDFVYAKSDVSGEGFGYIGNVSQVDVNGAIESIDNISSGSLYNQELYVNIPSEAGFGASIKLQGDNVGKIDKIDILKSGYDYEPDDTLSVNVRNIAVDITPKVGCIFNDIKAYKDITGFPSHTTRLQDSFYYQTFSYALQSKVRPELWRGLVRRIAHPAGTELFAIWENEASVYVGDVAVESDFSYAFKIISELLLEPTIEFSETPITKNINSSNSCSTFSNVNDLDDIKFSPNFKWTIEDFKDLTVEDLTSLCYDDLYLTNDSEITITT